MRSPRGRRTGAPARGRAGVAACLGLVVALALVAVGCGTSTGPTATGTAPTATATAATTPASIGTAPVPAPPCGTSRTVQYATYAGVDANLTSLDVYLPPATGGDCRNRPLVVWVHGGAWTGGDKSEYMADKIRLFTGAGWVFASVNYRLTVPTLVPPAPRYPVHDQDVADALAWLVDHHGELGVDPGRIAVLGHSAGGGIVAAITTDERYVGAHGLGVGTVRCAASMDGEGYDVTVGATHPEEAVRKVYRDAFGEDPAVWSSVSPMNHVGPGRGIPDYFIAARGGAVRLDLHADFASALRAAGVPVTVLDSTALAHADLAVDVGAPDDTVVTPALMAFLTPCLGP